MRFARAISLFRSSSLLLSLAAGVQALAAAPAKVQFNRDVRPILSDKCFHCHGFDSKKREAGLRLDVREDAIKDGAIAPGNLSKSEAMVRILSTDPDEHMPPAKSKLGSLAPAEVDILKRWIQQGAEYEAHWAFIPIQKPEVGTRSDAAAEGSHVSPMDEIVAKGLAERGLKFQKEATAETLIRRVSFDVTGLPPSPADVETFKAAYAKSAGQAYEALVDRLLASPQYGERMAVDWLDVSRYSDSYGFQVDRERDVWMWRDWVISAFNRNLPFDQFATWQIAGDLLPDATDEQILATAFNRLHQQESEGGSVEEEYRVEYVADRVQTFATAFLGLTFECSRCHDHKFDPISVQDYYGLFSLFQNIDEAGLYSFFTPSAPTPALMLLDDAGKKKIADLKAKVSDLERKGAGLRKSRHAAFESWLAGGGAGTLAAVPDEIGRYRFDVLGEGNTLANDLKADQPAKVKGENKLVPGRDGQALLFTGDDAVDLPFGNFKRQEPFSVSLWMQTPDVKDRAVVFHRSRAWTDAASRGYELLIEEGRLKWSLIHFWPGNAISVRAREPLPVKQWTHVTVAYDGSSRADGLKVYVNGELAGVDVIRDGLTKEITGGGGDNIALGERFRDRGFKGGMMDDFRVFNREVTALEAGVLHSGKSLNGTSDKASLQALYFATLDEEWKRHLDALKTARAELYQAQDTAKDIMVMRELPEPKTSYILFRGEYNQRREVAPPSTPSAVPPFSKKPPKNRLDLAKWLTSPENPLFARVTVNRIWQSIFGRGLVKTSEDFGSQGERPSYPELLDWLSWHFRESGWDVKGLMKTIVMSRTYRQDSFGGSQIMADDPDNAWLARGPRFRLPAEMIRDNALAASGLLKQKQGGPPVRPYELSEAFKPTKPDAGDEVYRRSLYTSWRRTSPPPAMIAFDAPRRAVCIAKRERTDSPLQALILLNGTQYVEAARVLGEKLHREAKGEARRMIEQAFLTCLSRRPDAREMTIVQRLYDEQLAHFRKQPAEAESLLKQGNAKRDAAISTPEAAAATVLAQTLMNHDASVVKR